MVQIRVDPAKAHNAIAALVELYADMVGGLREQVDEAQGALNAAGQAMKLQAEHVEASRQLIAQAKVLASTWEGLDEHVRHEVWPKLARDLETFLAMVTAAARPFSGVNAAATRGSSWFSINRTSFSW